MVNINPTFAALLLKGHYYLPDVDIYTYADYLTLDTLSDQQPDALVDTIYKVLDDIEWPLHVAVHPKQEFLERITKALFMRIDSIEVHSVFSRVFRPYRQNDWTPLHWTPNSILWSASRDKEHRWFFSDRSPVIRYMCNESLSLHWNDPEVTTVPYGAFGSAIVKSPTQTFMEFGVELGERYLGWPTSIRHALQSGLIPLDIYDKCAWIEHLIANSNKVHSVDFSWSDRGVTR